MANRLLGHSPADYAAEQEVLAERRRLAWHPPALPRGLRRLEAAACAAMGLGLVNPWAVLAGPFSPKLYPLDTVLGGGFGLIVVVAAALVFRETTRGAGRATRVALVALAAVLVALAVAAVVAPPVESGSQVVGVGLGLWLCLAGSLAMDYDKIEREIVISAPVDRVWAVITAPEHWLGEGDPAGFDLREAPGSCSRPPEAAATRCTSKRSSPGATWPPAGRTGSLPSSRARATPPWWSTP